MLIGTPCIKCGLISKTWVQNIGTDEEPKRRSVGDFNAWSVRPDKGLFPSV